MVSGSVAVFTLMRLASRNFGSASANLTSQTFATARACSAFSSGRVCLKSDFVLFAIYVKLGLLIHLTWFRCVFAGVPAPDCACSSRSRRGEAAGLLELECAVCSEKSSHSLWRQLLRTALHWLSGSWS